MSSNYVLDFILSDWIIAKEKETGRENNKSNSSNDLFFNIADATAATAAAAWPTNTYVYNSRCFIWLLVSRLVNTMAF